MHNPQDSFCGSESCYHYLQKLFSFSGRILMMDHDVKLKANIGNPN